MKLSNESPSTGVAAARIGVCCRLQGHDASDSVRLASRSRLKAFPTLNPTNNSETRNLQALAVRSRLSGASTGRRPLKAAAGEGGAGEEPHSHWFRGFWDSGLRKPFRRSVCMLIFRGWHCKISQENLPKPQKSKDRKMPQDPQVANALKRWSEIPADLWP